MRRHAVWILVLSWAVTACDDVTTDLVDDEPARDAGAQDASPTDAAARDAAPAPDARVHVRCGDHDCACDDGLDDDDDGLADARDPECTGDADDDEATFATGAPAGADECRDCFWDDNAGGGDDDCSYPVACLTGSAPAAGNKCASCEVSATCVDRCLVRTPPGCDCFGCCTVERSDAAPISIQLTDTCSQATLDDAQACPRCVRSTQCERP